MNLLRNTTWIVLMFLGSLTYMSCENNDDDDMDVIPTGNTKTYQLNEFPGIGIQGTAKFIENTDNSVTIELQLQNTPAGGDHPAHIHINSAAEGGGIALTLASVDGDSGFSTITVDALDDGSPISYQALLSFDGHINVHLSTTELSTIVTQGDIGTNELTGNLKSYDLESVAVPGISGVAIFAERVSGAALATLQLSNTPDGGEHPAHIHFNTAAEGGGIAFTFNPVNGDTGMSDTHVEQLDDGSPFAYADVLLFEGHINVHLSAADLATIVAQGDIGAFELTGEKKSYPLNESAVPGIEGSAEFAKRVNGSSLLTITLVNTPVGGSHPAHIHANSVAEGGNILVALNPVNGDSGVSKTHVDELFDGTPLSYDDILVLDAHINVHLSEDNLGTIVAAGDIGINEGAGVAASFTVTNNGSSSYTFDGGGFSMQDDPALTLVRGQTYVFNVNASGHPFWINSQQGTGTDNAYNEGVSNNGAQTGTITFTVPQGAPNTLYYNCQFHANMTNTITITD